MPGYSIITGPTNCDQLKVVAKSDKESRLVSNVLVHALSFGSLRQW